MSTGRYSCVGKQLGLMELRAVTSELVSRYNFSYAPTQNVSDFQKGKVDAFTLACAPLELIFTARKVSD
jgi:cytochrome P450